MIERSGDFYDGMLTSGHIRVFTRYLDNTISRCRVELSASEFLPSRMLPQRFLLTIFPKEQSEYQALETVSTQYACLSHSLEVTAEELLKGVLSQSRPGHEMFGVRYGPQDTVYFGELRDLVPQGRGRLFQLQKQTVFDGRFRGGQFVNGRVVTRKALISASVILKHSGITFSLHGKRLRYADFNNQHFIQHAEQGASAVAGVRQFRLLQGYAFEGAVDEGEALSGTCLVSYRDLQFQGHWHDGRLEGFAQLTVGDRYAYQFEFERGAVARYKLLGPRLAVFHVRQCFFALGEDGCLCVALPDCLLVRCGAQVQRRRLPPGRLTLGRLAAALGRKLT